MLCSLVSYAAFISKRFLFYADGAKLALVATLVLLWLLVQLFAVYLMMQKVRLNFVDAIVMKTSNKEALEKQSQGLIFVSQDIRKLLFSNKAAIYQVDPNVDLSLSNTCYWTEEQHASKKEEKKAVIQYM